MRIDLGPRRPNSPGLTSHRHRQYRESMKAHRHTGNRALRLFVATTAIVALMPVSSRAADHNDPNAANSIFSDIPVSAADLYDMFGFPADDRSRGDRVVLALTFASIPTAGTLDPDLLYRILVSPGPRIDANVGDVDSFAAMAKYIDTVAKRYASLKPMEIRAVPQGGGKVRLDFIGLPAGTFSKQIDVNAVAHIEAPGGHTVDAFVGGRDDAFFNDLPGFFRSINYAPQFYHVPNGMPALRELPIPKTL